MNSNTENQNKLIEIFKEEVELQDHRSAYIAQKLHNKIIPPLLALKMQLEVRTSAMLRKDPLRAELKVANATLLYLSNELHAVFDSLCTSYITSQGVVDSLKSLSQSIAQNYGSKLSVEVVPNIDVKNYDTINQRHIFFAHSKILQILWDQFETPLVITIIITSGAMNIEYKRLQFENGHNPLILKHPFLVAKIKSVQARLMILKASVGLKTDWLNKVKITIPLPQK